MANIRAALVVLCLLPGACATPDSGGMTGERSPLPLAGDPLALPAGYEPVWSDEFTNPDRPDTRNWQYETMRNRRGWFNGELQYYSRARPKNARVENGRLIIEAHAEKLDRTAYSDWSGQRFTSARLTTRSHASWRFGYFEVRAKLPCTRGAWPAIWLLPDHQDMRWQGGEIDLAETVGYEPDTVHHGVQTADRNFTKANHAKGISKVPYCNSWHDYQLLWTPDRIVIGVDGRVGFATDEMQPFDRKMALILNVAVGGEWAGAQGIDLEQFPARMEVESVRVWQKGGKP